MPPRPLLPNQFPGPCRLRHQPVAPGEGRAARTAKSWRNLCAACAADPGSAAARGARAGWVFALAHPGQPGSTFVGMSRFPALRCAQIVVDLVLEAQRRGEVVPIACDAWAIEVPDRFAARGVLRAALAGQEKEEGTYRMGLDTALAAARGAGISGEPVPVQPTLAEWNKSGQ